jgi:hypothetical protein
VENLVYQAMTSFYAYDFPSEIIYRIWDMMVLAMGTGFKRERKRAIWYVLAPAYYIMEKKQIELSSALTPKELIKAFNNGFVLTYNPDLVISELKDTVTKIFVTKTKIGMPAEKQGLFGSMVGRLTGGGSEATDKAAEMEKLRNKFEDDIDEIFENTEKENVAISQLCSSGGKLDKDIWFGSFLQRFQTAALKNEV